MHKILEKTERRIGEKLFIKGDRCAGPKCAFTRRSYPPGVHSKTRRRNLSEYGQLLKEKQKVRFLYGLDNKEIESYSKKAAAQVGLLQISFVRLLESRLDNVVFRSGFADSRRIARSLVNHRHIMVDGRILSIPSYQIRRGQTVAVKERSTTLAPFAYLDTKLKKYNPPSWLTVDKVKKVAVMTGLPEFNAGELSFDTNKIKEFYSR